MVQSAISNQREKSVVNRREWKLLPPAPTDFVQAVDRMGYSALVAQLLYNRDLKTPEQIDYYFNANYTRLADPYLIKDMDKAVERIKAALAKGERIAIYGDFDADGVTACSLLMQFFKAVGADVIPRIPHRVDEGYGLNPAALNRLAGQDVRLVITVDCGISNVAEVSLASEMGMDVIITDHHRPPEVLPEAFATLNVRQPGDIYPYKGMAGVGVAFHLVRALTLAGIKPDGGMKPSDLLDLVALGTVADIAPLTGENRVLVNSGLKALNKTSRPGVLALAEAAGVQRGELDTIAIGFWLAPRINAAGRIDDAILAYELLLTDDLTHARDLAKQLSDKNKERQQRLSAALDDARQRVLSERLHESQKILVLAGSEWAAGIVGLVAGRLCEEFNRPAIVLERGETVSRGSARSIPQFNVIEAISECHDLLLRYGGHKQAAGFSIETAKLPEFAARLQQMGEERLRPEALTPSLEIDAEITLDTLHNAHQDAQKLAPFGSENPAPVFLTRGLQLREVKPMGSEGKHARLKLFDAEHGRQTEAVVFNEGARAVELTGTKYLDIVYTIEQNDWQGVRSLRPRLLDFRPA
jgi:single-stranded-DNA-specific exonuclease